MSSQFQGFCRDLHTEAARAFVLILPQQAQSLVLARLVENRHLDRGNPNPGNLGSDFVRFGVELWPEVSARDSRNASRQKALGFLVAWRNAIAHQDFSSAALTPSRLRLAHVRRWRSACNALAREFDIVLAASLTNLAGAPPW